jgi:hypothetical protein
VETITYRLIDLEEQVLALHQRLQELTEAAAGDTSQLAGSAEVEHRLDDTEERLLRIESMLSRAATATAGSHLSVVDSSMSPGPAAPSTDPGPSGALDIDGPFPEEPEQPFLDDLQLGPDDAAAEADGEHGFLTA